MTPAKVEGNPLLDGADLAGALCFSAYIRQERTNKN
jgi:hypothetical protein